MEVTHSCCSTGRKVEGDLLLHRQGFDLKVKPYFVELNIYVVRKYGRNAVIFVCAEICDGAYNRIRLKG